MTSKMITRTLLLAFESEELTGHFSAMLRGAGYSVVPTGSAADAQRLLREGAADLALLDVDYGAETVRSLAQEARDGERPCPVAVVVGWWDARTAEVARCADTLIYKPPTQRQLFSSIEPLLDLLEAEEQRSAS